LVIPSEVERPRNESLVIPRGLRLAEILVSAAVNTLRTTSYHAADEGESRRFDAPFCGAESTDERVSRLQWMQDRSASGLSSNARNFMK
jgi:hypothetical protein